MFQSFSRTCRVAFCTLFVFQCLADSGWSQMTEFQYVPKKSFGNGMVDCRHQFNALGARGWHLVALGKEAALLQRTSPDVRWEYKMIEIGPSPLRDEFAPESKELRTMLALLHEQGWRVIHSVDGGFGLILSRSVKVTERPTLQTDLDVLQGVWSVGSATRGEQQIEHPFANYLRIKGNIATNASAEHENGMPSNPNDAFRFELQAERVPKQFKLSTMSGLTPRVILCGIYELEDDRLHLAYSATNPTAAPSSFDAKTEVLDLFVLSKAY